VAEGILLVSKEGKYICRRNNKPLKDMGSEVVLIIIINALREAEIVEEIARNVVMPRGFLCRDILTKIHIHKYTRTRDNNKTELRYVYSRWLVGILGVLSFKQ